MKVSRWPVIITLSRIGVVFAILPLMIFKPGEWSLVCCLLFIIGGITDWLDGYLARKLKSVTSMGKLLDPLADKVLVSSLLILFIPLQWIEPLAVLVLINRDVVISGIRSMAAARGLIISANSMGKWKTTTQMIAIPCLFLGHRWPLLPFKTLGYYGLWLSVVLSLVSGFAYFRKFMKTNSSPDY